MSAPARKRPGSHSPIQLTPKVEAIAGERQREDAPPAAQSDPPAPKQESAGTPASIATPAERGTKIARTYQLPQSLVREAETAVLRTGGMPGGYRSMAALMAGALERELDRLSQEYNDSKPFPANDGGFRAGRPLGS